MKIDQIKELVAGAEYDFLRTNEHVKDRLVFLTLGGSHAYGTNIETSDVDVRGCALNRATDLIGMSKFEQLVNEQTDTTIYSFNKLVSLMLNCNPNTIEMLGCKPEHYILMTPIGQEMLDNRHMFLSKRACSAFGGYATQQLRRLENAVARDRLEQARQEEHIRNSMQRALESFEDRYTHIADGGIELFVGDSCREGYEKEIFANISLSNYPAREFNSIMNDLKNVLDSYSKLNHRNHKKDEAHLNKHAMHLIRLYLMCLDILEKEEIVTYREKDRDFLMSIRNGYYQNDDGTFRQEFFDMVSEYEKKLDYAKNNTSLPAHPNMKLVEEFVMEVNRQSLSM